MQKKNTGCEGGSQPALVLGPPTSACYGAPNCLSLTLAYSLGIFIYIFDVEKEGIQPLASDTVLKKVIEKIFRFL